MLTREVYTGRLAAVSSLLKKKIMRNLPYNSKSTQIDEEFSKMVKRQVENNPEIHPIAKGIDDMLDVLRSCKPPKPTFTVESSDIDWNTGKITTNYFQNGTEKDDPECIEESQVDLITIQDFCVWMIKGDYHIITHEGHNHNGIFDQWTKTYYPEDLLRDPIFDLNYHLELFLSDRGY